MTENVTVMTMATTIEQALQPLLLTASVVGLGVYSPKKFYLSILYNLTIWIAYWFLYYYAVVMLKTEKWFLTLSTIVNLQITALTTVTFIIMNLYQHKRFRIFFKRLAAIDDTLKELGTQNVYGKLHTCSNWTLIGWCICRFIADTIDTTWWLRVTNDNQIVVLPYIVNHHEHVNMLMDLIFMTLIWYIGTRFDEIYEHMKYLLVKQEHKVKRTWRRTVTTRQYIMYPDNYKRVLWTVMHLHLELCQIARELNSMFGIQMTIEVTAYLIYLTRLCHFLILYRHYFDLSMITEWLDIFIWAFIYVIRLFCLNYVCESVCAKANKIDQIIHQLADIPRYADLRSEIYQFVLQVMHHPLKFTGLGLFYFGNGFLWK
ncbi:hypothetical protein X777_14753, partial [Ooceraea biroi]